MTDIEEMTLEELVLACGPHFTSLSQHPTSGKQPYEWCAEYHSFGEGGPVWVPDHGIMQAQGDLKESYEERGHTPIEAVRKLYKAIYSPSLT